MTSGERGNRLRPWEVETYFLSAGFKIEAVHVNGAVDEEYLQQFIPRLHQAPSSYRRWPVADLRNISAQYILVHANSESSRSEGLARSEAIRALQTA